MTTACSDDVDSAGERLLGAAQMALDQGDAGNWIDVATANGSQIMVDCRLRDGIVPNESTERLFESAGISLTAPVIEPPKRLEVVESGEVCVPSRRR